MWDEIQDMPGEIYDMEAFKEQVAELRDLMNKCIDLETYQKICEQDQINIGQ
tara:strand:+ start:2194 stop:2349 length:156 start_codon:yes stop_codon:yes gene_type:complete